jgi:hypothetical protein
MANFAEAFSASYEDIASSRKEKTAMNVLVKAQAENWSGDKILQAAALSGVSDNKDVQNFILSKKKEEAEKTAQAADAEFNMKAGPVLNQEIGGYLKANPEDRPMQQPQSGAIKNDTIPQPSAPQQQGANQFALGSDSFNQNLSNFAASLQNESSLSALPADNQQSSTPMGKGSAVDPKTAYNGLLKGIPADIARDLIYNYHNGLIKPREFLKEVAATKKSLNDIALEETKANQASSRKIREQGMQSQGEVDKQYVVNEGGLDQQNAQDAESLQRTREENASKERIASLTNSNKSTNERNALNAAEFGAKEKEMLGAVEEGKLLLSSLVDTFKANKFGNIVDVAGESIAKIPLAGKFIAGRNKEFQNQKRLAAETWLRAATGAAAPPYEVDTYVGFLPSESDPKDVADKKIENFYNKISAKASARSKIFDIEGQALEKRGLTDLASIKYEQGELVRQLIRSGKEAIPKIAGSTSRSNSAPNIIKSKSGNVYNLD